MSAPWRPVRLPRWRGRRGPGDAVGFWLVTLFSRGVEPRVTWVGGLPGARPGEGGGGGGGVVDEGGPRAGGLGGASAALRPCPVVRLAAWPARGGSWGCGRDVDATLACPARAADRPGASVANASGPSLLGRFCGGRSDPAREGEGWVDSLGATPHGRPGAPSEPAVPIRGKQGLSPEIPLAHGARAVERAEKRVASRRGIASESQDVSGLRTDGKGRRTVPRVGGRRGQRGGATYPRGRAVWAACWR